MLLKRRKRGKGKLLGPQRVVRGGQGGVRMGRRGGAVIGSEEAAEEAS